MKSFYQIPLTWSKCYLGSICNSSVVPSSWDDSETTDHSMITATSDSEDDLIKEFKKDLPELTILGTPFYGVGLADAVSKAKKVSVEFGM